MHADARLGPREVGPVPRGDAAVQLRHLHLVPRADQHDQDGDGAAAGDPLREEARLENGLDKLNSTKQIVDSLKKKLADDQPVLEATSKQVAEQQIQIAKDKEDAQVVKEEAETAAASANVKAAECTAIKEDAEAGLAEALPALDAAVKCLAKLDKSQIGRAHV